MAKVSGATSASGRGLGLGVVQMMNLGRTQFLLTYGDLSGRYHFDGLFSLSRNLDGSSGRDNTTFDIGGRIWYHLHAATHADFSVGVGLLLDSHRNPPADRRMDVLLDLGGQIRAFIVPNVALLGSLGMGISIRDNSDDVLQIGGKPLGEIGIAYFFE
jgi:hypothetical protein